MASTNKCLAQMNKSGTAGKATKKARNPASRVDPMGADHRVVPAIKQALSMLPQPWSQRAMLTSNDYKELAARCTELASESSEPTVAEALRALASDYLARAAKLHFVFLEQGTRLQGMSIVGAEPRRFSTIFCPRSNTTGELSSTSLVSIGAVGIHGQPWPEVSRPVRPQRAVSSEP